MKKHAKRLISFIFAVLMCISVAITVSANYDEENSVIRASDYLNYYSAFAVSMSEGEVIFEFEVDGVRRMDLVGVSRFVIQEKIDGKWTSLPTIWGSTSNGLMAEDKTVYVGEYIHETDSGTECRAIVTVYAEKDGGSDSRTFTTNSVTAK